jgi:predicted helicase
MVDCIPDYHTLSFGPAFPMAWYEEPVVSQGLFESDATEPLRREGISNWAVREFSEVLNRSVQREEIFYYVYGLFHSEEFRNAYGENLVKERPRIPFPKNRIQFEKFTEAGRQLAYLHLNYESIEPYPLDEAISRPELAPETLYKVTKMRFPRGQGVKDRPSTIHFNDFITLSGIPDETWDYMLSGKSALHWIIDRYQITQDKESGITNDPNEYSEDPRYIIDLFKRVVAVSLETLKIVESLPSLDLS